MNPVAGWYPDPSNGALIRWWDGSQWTAYTQPAQPPQSHEPVSTEPPRALALDPDLEAALRGETGLAETPSQFAFVPTLSPTADGSGREAAARALRQKMAPRGRSATLASGIITIITGLIVLFYFAALVQPDSMYPQRGEEVVPATVVEVSGPFADGSCAPIAGVTIDGQDYRAMARWNEVPCRWEEGSPVRVIYHPDDVATTLRVDGSDRETWPTIAVDVLGSTILLLGIYRTGRSLWALVKERQVNKKWAAHKESWAPAE